MNEKTFSMSMFASKEDLYKAKLKYYKEKLKQTNYLIVDVRTMVKNYLLDSGFDGLQNKAGECGCEIKDLAPCGNIQESCTAGYKVVSQGANCDYDFYICDGTEEEPPW